jgi:hypothetical protein
VMTHVRQLEQYVKDILTAFILNADDVGSHRAISDFSLLLHFFFFLSENHKFSIEKSDALRIQHSQPRYRSA